MNLPNRRCRNRRIRLAAAVAVGVLAGVGTARAQSSWWDRNWPYRRAVDIPAAKPAPGPRPAPKLRPDGPEIAWATIPTGGLCKPDGSDIRVATAGRNAVPCSVLMVGPGDLAKVAFAQRGAITRYYVYFGNDKPPAPREPLDIRRGVLMETRLYGGGAPNTLAQARKAFDGARTMLGRGFIDRLFIGHNPFGPQNSLATRYTAWLWCPADGTYKFACSSQDASFLLIDGKEIIANGGRHLPQRNVSKSATVKLTAGTHKLTLYHINVSGNPIAVTAWQTPGELRIWPIPAHAFLPVTEARCGPMAQYGKSVSASFMPAHGGETFTAGTYFQRWTFEAELVGNPGRAPEFKWDFGDGQTATAAKVEHVYLTPGRYTVALTAGTARGELTHRNRIYVNRPWDKTTSANLEPAARHAQIVQGYDFAALSAEANARAVVMLHGAAATEAMLKAGAALLARDSVPADALVSEAVPLIAAELDPAGRVEAYLQAEKLAKAASVRAAMAVRAGRVLLEELADAKGAMAIFDHVVRDYGAAGDLGAVRAAKVGVGDAWRAQGDLDQARKAYAAVGYGPEVNPTRVEISKGDYARHVEQYIRQGQFQDADDYIEAWAANMPADKLEGYWSVLLARKCMAQKHYAAAVGEAEVLVKVNPRSNYAPELLMLAAEAYRKLGKAAEADAALKLIVEKYPESPLAAQAANEGKKQ